MPNHTYTVYLAHLSLKLKRAFLITLSPSVHLSVIFFTFSTPSVKPLGQFQPKLIKTYHNLVKGIQACKNEGPCPLLRGNN